MSSSSLFGGSWSRDHEKKKKIGGWRAVCPCATWLLPNTGGRVMKANEKFWNKTRIYLQVMSERGLVINIHDWLLLEASKTVCKSAIKQKAGPGYAFSWIRYLSVICCFGLSSFLVLLSPLRADLNLWYETNNYCNFNLCIIYSQGGEAGHLLLYRRGAVHALPRTSSPTLFKVQSLLGIKHITETVSQLLLPGSGTVPPVKNANLRTWAAWY